MKVSRNTYYHWFRFKNVMVLETPKMKLKKRIRIIFEENRQIYGSSRIQKKLEREGLIYTRSYVGLLMKQMGLKSVLRRKYGFTTDAKHTFPIANNELNRDFTSLK
jgi:transposase InsO family protein